MFCVFQDANTFVPNNAHVGGVCKDGDAETLSITFKEFSLDWYFAKVRNQCKVKGGNILFCFDFNDARNMIFHPICYFKSCKPSL